MATFSWADLYEITADAVGDRRALICGDRRLTYAELDERGNRVAHWLAEKGCRRGDHIGLYLENGTEYVETMLGAFKLGVVPVNVNYRYVEDELRYLFEDADLVGVVHEGRFAARVAAVRPVCPGVRWTLAVDRDAPDPKVTDYELALASASPARDFEARAGDDLYVLYTGGTTGMPKGVVWRQEDAFYACLSGGNPLVEPPRTPEEVGTRAAERVGLRTMPCAPLIHGAAQWTVWMTFFGGGILVLTPGNFDADRVLDVVETEHVNVITIVGDAMARPLADALARQPRDLASLYIVGSGGAIFSQAVQDELCALVPHLTIVDSFGVSEAGYQGSKQPDDTEAGPRFLVGPTTAVLDENLEPLPPGSGDVGMLARTGHIPLRYHKDPEKTARTFRTGPDGRRWALPGDLATVGEDGVVTLLGRGNQSINTGGEKVYPEEVETHVKAHPAVYDALVVGAADPRWGQRVAAVVSLRTGATLTLEDLQAHCRDRLAGFKVPRALVTVDEVVRAPTGKPDYAWAKRTVEAEAALRTNE